jgi:hypothetical protein
LRSRNAGQRTRSVGREHLAPADVARFHTKSGLLTAERKGDLIELDFPATLEQRADAPAGLLESLGISEPVAHLI